jgi:HD-GYP domain-containing protein (c-di-GMP phosphodiesterase class II)
MCLSDAMDLVSPAMVDHHKHVAYIAMNLAREMGFAEAEQDTVAMAGLLHESGAMSLEERLLGFRPFQTEEPHRHAEMGFFLLKGFEPFNKIAPLVRFHHQPWNFGRGEIFQDEPIPKSAHLLHLADQVTGSLIQNCEILSQVKTICEKIESLSGEVLVPEQVDAFLQLAGKEYFWLGLVSPSITTALAGKLRYTSIVLDISGLLELARLFCRVIDLRSLFTATHSSGVAATSETLARLIGFSERECQLMKIAGYLHDLGKLAIPETILEKPGKLTADEFNVMKSHAYYTYCVLQPVKDLEVINTWASFHHERLNGTGYPFHHKADALSLGSRIVAVADVFTALTENRPYRAGMANFEVINILNDMAHGDVLDPHVVSVLSDHYDEVSTICSSDQSAASDLYQSLLCHSA